MPRFAFVLSALVLTVGCKPKPATYADGANPPANETTETRVVKEGGKTKVVTITRKVVEAPAPPPRPADPLPGDPLVKLNLDVINAYRKKHGVAPVVYDAKISAFALAGSKQLAKDHKPHAHFNAKIKGQLGDPAAMKGKSGFGSRAAENQGDWNGIPELAPGAQNGKAQIELTMKLMYDEGPGGGHHDNMLNPKFRRVGIGLHYVGKKLYLTNDFSD